MEPNKGPTGESSNRAHCLTGLSCTKRSWPSRLRKHSLGSLPAQAAWLESRWLDPPELFNFSGRRGDVSFHPRCLEAQLGSPLSHQQPAQEMVCFFHFFSVFPGSSLPLYSCPLSLNTGRGKHREEGSKFRVRDMGEGMLDWELTELFLINLPHLGPGSRRWERRR